MFFYFTFFSSCNYCSCYMFIKAAVPGNSSKQLGLCYPEGVVHTAGCAIMTVGSDEPR